MKIGWHIYQTFLTAGVMAVATGLFTQKTFADDANTLWYAAPASKWIEAMPIGNGRLGAMIFGDPAHERLQLNDVTVWSGDPDPNADRPTAYKSLPQLRQLISDGKYDEAEKFANNNFNCKSGYNASYQTLGDLKFEFALPGEVSNYRRQLDLGSAIAAVSFKAGDVTYSRELFASAPDHAIVQHLTADRPGSISFTMSLARNEKAQTQFEAPGTLVMKGATGKTLTFQVRARVIAHGGTISEAADHQLTVQNADSVDIFLTAATSFVLDYKAGYKGGDLSLAEKQLQAVAAKSYEAVKKAHVAEYANYFGRVKLDLGPTDASKPTDERLKSYHDNHDPSFAALFYQFGRYLLISSSRPDNPLPSNSQGLWGDGYDLPWKCDYKSNINYEMSYWSAEPSNLNEMHLPMLRMTENLVGPGTKTARSYFGPDTPGWVCSYTTNGWSWTSPGHALAYGIWFGGSGWMCQHLWDHYAFTQDAGYLKSAYPTLKGAAEFYLANLVTAADGRLVMSPSSSPENGFVTDTGVKSSLTQGTAIDDSIVWDVFDNTARAAAVLGIDADFARKLLAARDRIAPLKIGKAGQIEEWNGDWDMNAPDIHHRHISHMFGLHPGHEITFNGTPDLAAAAKKSLQIRGDDGTGWSLAWKINCWARLHDGDHAYHMLDYQFRYTEIDKIVMADAGGTYANLFDAHPPFQIDGNFGFVSGVNEMLLQSQQRYVDPNEPLRDHYYIDLLPALPSAWANGSVSGVRARGGFEISLTWQGGKLMQANIKNVLARDASTRVRIGEREINLTLHAGESRSINPE